MYWGASYSNDNGPSTGTMIPHSVAITPGVITQTIPAGYHGTSAVAGDSDLAAGNILSGTAIFDVTGTVIEASGNAAGAQVPAGVSFSNADGPSTGTMPDNGAAIITPGASAQTIPAGYHNGSGYVAGDSDLTADNIRKGTAIFNITGTVVIADAPAPVPQTGSVSIASGDDGDLQKGVAWPTPRFTDNGDGTVTDNLTSLIWLSNATCTTEEVYFSEALDWVALLSSGQCDLTDGSQAGDWRLPNLRELESLVDYGYAAPALPDTMGTGQASAGDPFASFYGAGGMYDSYWTSTPSAGGDIAVVDFFNGETRWDMPDDVWFVWPVRDE